MVLEGWVPTVAVMTMYRELFNPKSIAVIGASADPTRLTGRIVPGLLRHGYSGQIYPVNPNRRELSTLPCYRALTAIPHSIDCVVYGIGAGEIMGVLRQCVEKQVKLVVAISGGFAETRTKDGIRLQRDATEFARAHGMRILGPNVLGFWNFVDQVVVSGAALMECRSVWCGRIGVVSQSGGLGLATIPFLALKEGIDFSYLISTGNEGDIDTIEIAEFLVGDDDTDVIVITIEAVRDSVRFIALLEHAGEVRKPIVVLKSGRSALGKVMAASHTGAVAGRAEVFEMVCREYGVTLVDDVDDLYWIASMFGRLRVAGKLQRFRAPAKRCAALSFSGGHVGLFADHASLAGVEFPALSKRAQCEIAQSLGFESEFSNPLDTTGRVMGDPGFWGRCLSILVGTGEYEVVVAIFSVGHSFTTAIQDFIKVDGKSDEIIIVCWPGGSFTQADSDLLRHSRIPVFRTSSRAAAGLKALDAYCSVWNGAGVAASSHVRVGLLAESRKLLLKAKMEGRHVLTEHESKSVLAAAGVPSMNEIETATVDETLSAAKVIGYPVVLKGEHPEIFHKSEAGLVFLNIHNDLELREAASTAWEHLESCGGSTRAAHLLVQPMVSPALEVILGASTDPEFGLVIVFGMGGIFVETMKDVSMRLPPFSVSDARAMIERLRSVALLKGARGRDPVDLDSLAALISRFSIFVDANRDLISEIDVNPLAYLKAGPIRWCVLDALILLRDRRGNERRLVGA